MSSSIRRAYDDGKRLVTPLAALLSLTVALPGVSGCVGEQSASSDASDGVAYEDSDNDSIIDVHEGPDDTDGDGTPDYLDTDSDNDQLTDAVEAGDDAPLTYPLDSDGDGSPDFRDPDSDDNGVPDSYEYGTDPANPLDLDGDGLPDLRDPDNDGDGIADVVEIGPAQPLDSDGDSQPDYLDTDSDNDGILDLDEARIDAGGNPRDTDEDGIPDFRDLDSDGDGFLDALEAGDDNPETAPIDTDTDGLPDFIDSDSDGDAIRDVDEASYGTDVYLDDSDGDGYSDGGEVAAGSDPTASISVPQGLYFVVPQRSVTSESFEFTAAIGRADVVFVLDTTGSMGPTLTSLASDFSTAVSEVQSQIPDAAFAVVTFKDYNDSGMGAGGDKPFILNQQVTTNLSLVQSRLSGLSDGSGGDLPESAMEALYQATTGRGFDQDCDAAYDSETDVAPFVASSQDVFHGAQEGAYDATDSSTGLLGGVGIRRYALPVFVWTTDTDYRDPDAGDPAPDSCSSPAGRSKVVTAMNDIGGKLIGINAGGETELTDHMTSLAEDTYSEADLDGDGELDPLVFSSQGGPEIVEAVVAGITALNTTGQFQEVALEVDGDEWGFVQDIEPPLYTRVSPGETLDFSLTLFGASPAATDDQIFKLNLVVVGDGSTSLDSQQILIVVPGSA